MNFLAEDASGGEPRQPAQGVPVPILAEPLQVTVQQRRIRHLVQTKLQAQEIIFLQHLELMQPTYSQHTAEDHQLQRTGQGVDGVVPLLEPARLPADRLAQPDLLGVVHQQIGAAEPGRALQIKLLTDYCRPSSTSATIHPTGASLLAKWLSCNSILPNRGALFLSIHVPNNSNPRLYTTPKASTPAHLSPIS